jgi:CO/xanthine dehydrogenase Mo-binding subunit
LDAEGRVTVRSAEGDIGQGARTIAAIIAAEEFDVGLDRVHVGETTTEDTPNTLGAFASRLVLIAGHAVRNAVADAKKQLLPIAAEKLEASTDDLVWQDGAFQIRGTPGRSISLEEVCKEAVSRKGGKAIRGKGEYDPPSENYHPKTLFGNISVAYEFAAQAAEVEVDIETGHLRILRLVAADDVGRMLNPLAVHGQVEGATVQGVGFALTEEMKTEAGQVINGNFGDYALPKAETVPSVTSVAIESNDPFGPYGAKGASEAAIVPTAPAIANAIFHATGIRMTSLPISAEKMLAAIQAHHKGEVNSRTCAGFVDPR